MKHESIDGVVIRVRDYGDHDRYLSVLTAEEGRITLLSKGSRSLRGGQTAVSQLYTYGNFEYYKRGDFNILKGGSPIQPFYALSADIDRLNLAAYFCEVSCEVTDQGEEAGEMLRLLLNSLYAVSRDLYPQPIIKGAFELRVAALSGYEPEIHACCECASPRSDPFYLNVMNGALLCAECLQKSGAKKPMVSTVYDDIREAELLCTIPPAVHAAMQYCLHSPIERIFSFDLKDGEDLRLFSGMAETYLLSHLGRGFDSLNFYHAMRQTQAPKEES